MTSGFAISSLNISNSKSEQNVVSFEIRFMLWRAFSTFSKRSARKILFFRSSSNLMIFRVSGSSCSSSLLSLESSRPCLILNYSRLCYLAISFFLSCSFLATLFFSASLRSPSPPRALRLNRLPTCKIWFSSSD